MKQQQLEFTEDVLWNVKNMNFFLVPLFPCVRCMEQKCYGLNWFLKVNHDGLAAEDIVMLFTLN